MLILGLPIFPFSSVFPNGLRYPCTTMPWTIWPALVVLWGVCWMFYPPNDAWQPIFEDPNQYLGMPVQGWLDSSDLSSLFNFTPSSMNVLLAPETIDLQQLHIATETYPPPQSLSLSRPETMPIYEPQTSTPGGESSGPTRASFSPFESDSSDDLPTCPTCGESFSRSDVCARHQRESCPKIQQLNASHYSYHCPYSPCNRASPGKGFVRKDHLRQHLGHCAVYKQMQLEKGGTVGQQTVDGSALHQTCGKRKATEDLPRENGRRPRHSHSRQKAGTKSQLEKVYRRRLKNLERREKDCQQERQELEKLERAIQGL